MDWFANQDNLSKGSCHISRLEKNQRLGRVICTVSVQSGKAIVVMLIISGEDVIV